MTRAHSIASRRDALRALGSGLFAAVAFPAGVAVAQTADRSARIVSLGGAVTEIAAALGAADRVVAIDTTSTHPADLLRTKPNVGYLRQLSAEGILSVRPSLVIAAEGAGPPDSLKLVREAGVVVEIVPDEPSPDGIRVKISTVARLVGREAEGAVLARTVADAFAALDGRRTRLGEKKRVLFVLSAQSGRMIVGGRGTSAAGMLSLAGAENAAEAVEGFKPMSDEAVLAAQPDIVLTMQVGPGGAASAGLLDGPALSRTPAGRAGRLVAMDGSYLLGFGPRAPAAARDLMDAVYPGRPSE